MHSPLPALSHSLGALSAILKTAETHCEANKIDPNTLLEARLADDMLPLIPQIRIACDTAKGAAARLTGGENPVMADEETTFADLQERIAKTLAYLKSVPDAGFEGAEDRTVKMTAGGEEFTFTGSVYLATFVVPNFYFHVTTAYNILRHNGVTLGKRDYLGG